MSDDFRRQLHRNFDQEPTDELIQIWQANNRVEWTDMTFDVIREILVERLVELPPQNEPFTEAVAERLREKTGKLRFNWKLPVFGAIGFGISFALMGVIMLTIYNISQNSVAHAFQEAAKVGIEVGALRGIVVGGIGGAALGLALKDRMRAYYFSLAGAIGFGWGFAIVISIDSFLQAQIGWKIMELMGGPVGGSYSSLEAGLARGLGTGVIIGAVGGSVLGLASARHKAISSLLLCFAGILAFGNIFAFGNTIFDGNFFSLWNALGGALGGATLGLALAVHYMIADRMQRKPRLDQGLLSRPSA